MRISAKLTASLLLVCVPLHAHGALFFGQNINAPAGILLVTGNNCTSGNATSTPVDARGANFAAVAVSNGLAGNGILSDNNGNVYTKLTGAGSNPDANLYYTAAGFVGVSAHTWNVTGSTFPGFCVLTFGGLSGSPFDKENSPPASAIASGIRPGALTAAAANSLYITSVAYFTVTVTSNDLGAGFSQSGVLPSVGGVSYAVAIAYKIQVGGPSSEDPLWSFSGADSLGAKMAVFK